MSDAVHVRHLSLTQRGDQQRLAAEIDGDLVGFDAPAGTFLAPRAEPFLALALQEAMARRVPLVLDPAHRVSPAWVRNLQRVQAVLLSWNDEDMGRVPVQAMTAPEPEHRGWGLSTFSGGVDSSYTFMRCRDQVSHVLLVQGFDTDDEDGWRRNVAARRAFADRQGVALLPVANNVRSFLQQRRLSWNLAHGGLLASLGVALGARGVVIPSTFTYSHLIPWGSHPLLDPLWSTDQTTVTHHGADCGRTEKTRQLLQSPELLDQLQVCWRSVDQNCGECPKCIRTSLALYLLGARSAKLPPYHSADQLAALRPTDGASLAYTEELIRLASVMGHPAVAQRLRRDRRRYLLKMHAVEWIKLLGGRRLKTWARGRSAALWRRDRVKLQAARDWLDEGVAP
ncbi:MAG: hypothetical protein ACK5W4_10650 [Inhella sp.]|uniref:hypothetical protein n=1 Tax=Inhella sp. TaxID=1921806 RepID=UPI00391F6A99